MRAALLQLQIDHYGWPAGATNPCPTTSLRQPDYHPTFPLPNNFLS